MTDAGDLPRLRRLAVAGLRQAASAFDEAVAAPLGGQASPMAATRYRAAPEMTSAMESLRLSVDNELAVQELVNMLIPAIENALRNRRDFGAL